MPAKTNDSHEMYKDLLESLMIFRWDLSDCVYQKAREFIIWAAETTQGNPEHPLHHLLSDVFELLMRKEDQILWVSFFGLWEADLRTSEIGGILGAWYEHQLNLAQGPRLSSALH